MAFWQNINPIGAIADFRQVYHEAGSNRWWITALAILVTTGLFSSLAWETWKKPRPLPQITYVTSWPEDRTRAETAAFIAENQKRKDERERLDREQEAIGQKLWMQLGRASGVDVDKLKKQADADKAAAAAAAKARAEQILQQTGPVPVAR